MDWGDAGIGITNALTGDRHFAQAGFRVLLVQSAMNS